MGEPAAAAAPRRRTRRPSEAARGGELTLPWYKFYLMMQKKWL